MSGAMGGSASEEFLVVSDTGEDTYIRCRSCDHAANVEAVKIPAPSVVADEAPAVHFEPTPDTPTIEALVRLLNERYPRPTQWSAADTMKNVVVTLRHPDGRWEPLAIGLSGDRDVDEKRLQARVEPAVWSTHFPTKTSRPTRP